MDDTSKVTLKCPECGSEMTVDMPTDRSLVLQECQHCGHMMKPKEGDCCVICSHGDKKCPVSTQTKSQEVL